MQKITIGSRGSDLALWQANHVKRQRFHLQLLRSSANFLILPSVDAIHEQHLAWNMNKKFPQDSKV